MNSSNPNTTPKNKNLSLVILSSVLLTFFIAFIDEGYYNFQWMSDPGSWVAFMVYTSLFFCILYLIFLVFLKRSELFGKIMLSSLMIILLVSMIFIGIANN